MDIFNSDNEVTQTAVLAQTVTSAIRRRLNFDQLGLVLVPSKSPLDTDQITEVEEWLGYARRGIVAIQRSEGQTSNYLRDLIQATDPTVGTNPNITRAINHALRNSDQIEIPRQEIVAANLATLNYALLAAIRKSNFASEAHQDGIYLGDLEYEFAFWPPYSTENTLSTIESIGRTSLQSLSGLSGASKQDLLKAGHFFDSLSRLG